MNSIRTKISEAPLFYTLVLAVCIISMKTLTGGFDLRESFSGKGNDDIMRLLMVRDFIGGQGWYDYVMYRVLPPEGMPIHWSRYIDAGIAAVILPLSYVFEMETAELLGASIWPLIIQLISVAVVAFGTKRLFGPIAACFAVISMVLWPVTSDWHSSAGNIDHHNVQMLMMTIVALCVVWPGNPFIAGVIGGVAAAFSLAVGLEALVFCVVAGAVLFTRMLISYTESTRRLLLSFCVALALGSVLFWIGQASPAGRIEAFCVRLSQPALSIIWVAAISSTLPLLIVTWKQSALLHLTLTTALCIAGLAFVWPLLSTCLDGPYAQLPPEIQQFISAGVGEALPGLVFIRNYPETAFQFVLPLLIVPTAVAWFLLNERRDGKNSYAQNTALIGLTMLCLAGTLMALYQMRSASMAATVVPMLTGYIVARLLGDYLEQRDLVAGFLGLLVATAIISPGTFAAAAKPFLPVEVSALAGTAQCRSYEAVSSLNEAEPGSVLTHFNFGPSLLWATHHDALSAGYHTSATAMLNSVTPFRLDEAELESYLRDAGATYFLLCRDASYAGDFVTSLAAGAETDWLQRVPLSNEDQVLLKLLPN